MGKTKTAFIGADNDKNLSGEEKYKQRQKRKEEEASKKAVSGVGLKGGERIKVVSSDPVVDTSTQSDESESKSEKKDRKRGKRYLEERAKVSKDKLYSLKDAIDMVKKTSYSKFDGTMEAHFVVKKQGLSVKTQLPFSFGKSKKVVLADENVLSELKQGKINFDVLLSTPDMMPKLVAFAKLLGPRGLMPNPKNGTIVKSAKDKDSFSGNTINLKTEKDQPNIHTSFGKVSQKDEELTKNFEALINSLTTKQIVKAYIKATMSPSVKVEVK